MPGVSVDKPFLPGNVPAGLWLVLKGEKTRNKLAWTAARGQGHISDVDIDDFSTGYRETGASR
jgi:hypothetical protein